MTRSTNQQAAATDAGGSGALGGPTASVPPDGAALATTGAPVNTTSPILDRLLGELAQAVAADAGVRLFADDGQGMLEEVAGTVAPPAASRLERLVGRKPDDRGEQFRTLLVPVPDQRRSVILLSRRGLEDFTAEDRAVARLYARQLVVGSSIPEPPTEAVWARQLDAIQNVAAQLTRLTSMHEVAEAICVETRRVIDYDNARVYVVAP